MNRSPDSFTLTTALPETPSSTRSSSSFLTAGGLWVIGQIILMVSVILTGILTGGQWHSVIAFVVGWVLFGIGGLIGIWGKINLGANRTPLPQPKATGILVQHGIYRRIRHPLYSSLLFASLGWALIWSSYVTLLTAVVLSVFLNAKASCEERWMRQRFPEYSAYAARVKKLIPFVY